MKARSRAIRFGVIIAIFLVISGLATIPFSTEDSLESKASRLALVKPAFAQTAEIKSISIDTDSSWKSLDAEVKGWTSAAFDDSWWPDSCEASTPIPSLSQAKAIWYPLEPEPSIAYFRKTFQIDGAEVVSGRITVMIQHTVLGWRTTMVDIYVNEQFVDSVRHYSNQGSKKWDFDITPYLTVGENAIAVKVKFPENKHPTENWGLSGVVRYALKPLLEPSSPSPMPAPAPQPVLAPGQPYADLYGQVTDVTVGEEVIMYLSVVNPITSPGNLVVQLTLCIPSGWSITSSGFGHGAGGLRTNSYEIEQGPNPRTIDVHILANQKYDGEVTGYLDYYFADEAEYKYHKDITLPVKATIPPPAPEEAAPAPEKGGGFSCSGLAEGTHSASTDGELLLGWMPMALCWGGLGGCYGIIKWRRRNHRQKKTREAGYEGEK